MPSALLAETFGDPTPSAQGFPSVSLQVTVTTIAAPAAYEAASVVIVSVHGVVPPMVTVIVAVRLTPAVVEGVLIVKIADLPDIALDAPVNEQL